MAGTPTNTKVAFIEVVSNGLINATDSVLSSTASIGTGDIVFIPTLHSIYHNGEYYGFTEADRKIVDNNNNALLNLLNNKINDIKINGSTTLVSKSSNNSTHLSTVDIALSGTTLPISTVGATSIKSYIDTEINKATSYAASAGVTKLTVGGIVTPLNNATGAVSFNVSGTSTKLGKSYSGTNTYATPLDENGTIATSIEKLDKEILRRYTTLNTKISTNSSSIATLNGIIHTINSASASDLSSKTSQDFSPTTNSTIVLNSTNIVVGGAALSGSAITTTNSNESIHKALENLYSRLDLISDVSSTTVTTLKQLENELRYGTGDNFATTFLDKVGWLINGFDGVNVATAASTNAKDVSLKNAVETMINTATTNAPYITSIAFTSNTATNNQLGKTITADASTHSGTVNITGNKVVVGSNVTTTHTTTTIASTDSIATALGKLQKEINSVSENAASGIDAAPYFTTINVTSNTNASDLTETAAANNHTATLNVRAKDLILGEQSTAGATLLATTDTIVAALNKLNKQTKTDLNSKLSSIKVNNKSITTTNTSATLDGRDIKVTGYTSTTVTTNITTTDTINGALSKLELKATTAISNLGTVNSAIATLQTKVGNLESDNHMYWYTL